MISNFEQQIYNNHLVASRKAKEQPFKIRKDFSNLDEDKANQLKKLARFFNSYGHINQEDFFIAPYKLHDDQPYCSLEFYSSMKAISYYTQYMKQLELEDADSDESIMRLKTGFKFVYNFCKETGISLDDYKTYSEGALPIFVAHLKEHKINFYTLHALTFSNPMLDSKLVEFVIPDFFITFQKTKIKFYNSKAMKEFSKLAKEKINSLLNTNLLERTKLN